MSETVPLTHGLPSHVRPGLVIAGKYRLEEEIGRGSMGTVYRAVHVTLGQRVAIKLISAEHLQSSEARKRFGVEAKAAAKLRSRHVVQVYDDGETSEGNPYIVLEYLEGETLEQRLQREHDLPLADAVRIVTHVGRALARAHAQGIVHRDLKPANVFLVKSDDDDVGWLAKVLDFGIAKLDQGEKGTTQDGTVLGTPLFMSPEQVRGASSVDHRADLYSLGMCLFHMLTGDFAYYAPNYSDILIGICTLPLPRLRETAPWVPETIEQWFQRACAREPLERFQSADEMTEALQAAAGGAALSKHKSFPEGRIAPETLVGYATPAMATLQLDAGPLASALSRTQAVAQQPSVSSASVPVSIAIGESRRMATPNTWAPPRRGLPPLVLGIGLGLFVVAVTAVTFTLLSRGDSFAVRSPDGEGDKDPKRSQTTTTAMDRARTRPSTGLTASSQSPAAPEPGMSRAPAPAPAGSKSLSSVAAESVAPPPKARGKAVSPRKTGSIAAGEPPPTAPPPARKEATGSDLGF